MASIDDLPPDQRAVLELVLRRGRSYDEIAQLLSIDHAGVRQRAALGRNPRLRPERVERGERRALITDYLLGALPAPSR
jgi:DNA-directed RNA polymerase specialized sigma24 family protein